MKDYSQVNSLPLSHIIDDAYVHPYPHEAIFANMLTDEPADPKYDGFTLAQKATILRGMAAALSAEIHNSSVSKDDMKTVSMQIKSWSEKVLNAIIA